MVANKQIIFTKVPNQQLPVNGEHFKIAESSIDLNAELPEGDILLKTLEISADSYLLDRMRDPEIQSWNTAFEVNKPFAGDTLSVVIKSNNANYKVDDIVLGRTLFGFFEEYVQVNAEYAKEYYVVRNEAKDSGLPLSRYLGSLGMPGFTAWYGLTQIGKPKKGEVLYVSAAAGPVGQMVGQLGKAYGMYVVGSAGSQDKIDYLKSVGFDATFNYKDGDIEENLKKHLPGGKLDIYWDNIGGEMLDAALNVANDFSRFISCGMTSQYDLETPTPLYNIINVVMKRIRFEGFQIMEHPDLEVAFLNEVTPLLVDGTIKYKETIFDGIESFPEAFTDVLKGGLGKGVVHIADL